MIQDYYQRKQFNGARVAGKKGGLSPKTIWNHHMIPKDFFTCAEKKFKLDCNPTLETTRPNPENLLFPSTAGTYIDPKSYEIRLSAVSKRCEIKKVNPRALRHMCASTKLDLIR